MNKGIVGTLAVAALFFGAASSEAAQSKVPTPSKAELRATWTHVTTSGPRKSKLAPRAPHKSKPGKPYGIAHNFGPLQRGCGTNAFGLPCEGTLANNEAIWFATAIFNIMHPWHSLGAAVTHRINSSAACVYLGLGFKYGKDVNDFILVDIDRSPLAGAFIYYATGHWGDHPC